MEDKFKPLFRMIPVLSDVISTSYDPTPGLEEEEVDDDNEPVIDD